MAQEVLLAHGGVVARVGERRVGVQDHELPRCLHQRRGAVGLRAEEAVVGLVRSYVGGDLLLRAPAEVGLFRAGEGSNLQVRHGLVLEVDGVAVGVAILLEVGVYVVAAVVFHAGGEVGVGIELRVGAAGLEGGAGLEVATGRHVRAGAVVLVAAFVLGVEARDLVIELYLCHPVVHEDCVPCCNPVACAVVLHGIVVVAARDGSLEEGHPAPLHSAVSSS